MLSTNQSFTHPGDGVHAGFKERIELNAIMEQVVREAGLRNSSVVLRCAHLPHVEGVHAAYLQLFRQLVGLITGLQQRGTPLFLHVDCMESAPEVDAGLLQGRNRYEVQFHTSAATDAAWAEKNETAFAQCRELLQGQGAQLEVFAVRSTGCLFSISLLGKQ